MIILKRRFKKSKAYHSLSKAVKEAGKEKCLLIVEGNHSVKTNVIIPQNIKLRFPPNCSLNIGKGKKLIIEDPPKSLLPLPPFQIFKGFGNQELGKKDKKYSGNIHPEWWGAK